MPQAIPVAIMYGTVAFAEYANFYGIYYAGVIAAGAAMSAGASNLIARQTMRRASSTESSQGLLVNSRSTEDRVRVVYGTRKVGGTIMDMGLSGTDNEYLWIVLGLAEGECEGIVQVDGVDQIFLGDELWNTFGGNVAYWFHAGTADQAADANLLAALPEKTDTYHNRCYLVMRLKWSPDYFMSLPLITVLLAGKKVTDFRDDTYAYSANPVLARYDYMTASRYGMGIAASEIDETSYGSAANYCDTKGWECHLVLDGDITADEVLDAIDILFRGRGTWWNGLHYLRYADLNYETSVMELTDEHVARDESGKYLIALRQPSGARKPSGIKVTFTDPAKGYVADSFVIGEENGYIPDLTLAGCIDRDHAATIATYELERQKLDRVVEGTFRDDALQLEPGDVPRGTFSAIGMAGQYLRVVDAGRMADGRIPLTLAYESVALYDDVVNLVEDDVYTCTLPDPKAEPPGVGGVTVTEETYSYRLRTGIRLKVEFSPPAGYSWFDHVEVWQSFDDETWSYLFPSGGSFELAPVEEGRTYFLRIKVVSIHGRKQADANDHKISHLVAGVSATAPASLVKLDAIVAGSSVNLYAVKLLDSDIELYEYRLGTPWNGAIFLASMLSPNLSLAGVKPGTHTFMACSKGTNGIYGTTPRSAVVSLVDPPDGWALQDTETFDFTTGTVENAEHTTYNSEDHLKCSHTDSVLAGTWTSPVVDQGSSVRQLVYALADIVVTGAATSWEGVVPDPQTWADIDAEHRTWAEIFQLDAGPSVRMTLLYGDNNPPTSEVGRLEILFAVVTARFFQIKVEITDPSLAIETLVEELQLKFCQAA